jgi:nicotinamidase-related amidase
MSTISELVEPTSTVVLCHEMQRGVVGDLARPGWQTAEAVAESKAVPVLADLFAAARSAGSRVIHCGAAFRRDYAGSFANTPILRGRMADPTYLIEGTGDVEPLPELWDKGGDLVVHRFHGMSTFAGTELDWILKSLGTQTVIVTGVSINRGVFGTVIEAVNYGYQVVVPRDCVVGYPRDYGEIVLEHSLAALAWLSDSAEVMAAWAL